MSAPIIAFFNNTGGVGTTSLVYHLAWMFNDLGWRVLAADLDPQANLSAALFDEDRLEQFWPDDEHPQTIDGCLEPLKQGTGDFKVPHLEIEQNLLPLVGDLRLAAFEDELSSQWAACFTGNPHAFRVVSAFWRILQEMGRLHRSHIVLIDLGPNLGAINRAALIAADYLIVPLAPDLFSLQGLRNLGPAIQRWREGWQEILRKAPPGAPALPRGKIEPIGYIVQQHSVRLDRPAKSYEKWMNRIPAEYERWVSGKATSPPPSPRRDPHCLALLKHYRSLMPMAEEARKPMFQLTVADGAIGSHLQAAQSVRQDFAGLASTIAQQIGIEAGGKSWRPPATQ